MQYNKTTHPELLSNNLVGTKVLPSTSNYIRENVFILDVWESIKEIVTLQASNNCYYADRNCQHLTGFGKNVNFPEGDSRDFTGFYQQTLPCIGRYQQDSAHTWSGAYPKNKFFKLWHDISYHGIINGTDIQFALVFTRSAKSATLILFQDAPFFEKDLHQDDRFDVRGLTRHADDIRQRLLSIKHRIKIPA